MRKNIYLYLNNEDLSIILDIIYSNGAYIYDKELKIIDKIPAISDEISTFYIGYLENYIEYTPCFHILKYLQPAKIALKNDENELNILFMKIKKYIRKDYILSTDKLNYLGPNMYNDWLKKTYMYPSLLKYVEFKISDYYLKDLIDESLKEGYEVKTNRVRLRDVDIIDYSADEYVIYLDKVSMVTSVIRKSILVYEYDSECIWVYRRKKDGKILIQLDKRLADDSTLKISKLFDMLKKRWERRAGIQ